MDDISLGLYPGLRLCPLDLTTDHGLLRCPSLYCGASLDSFSHYVIDKLINKCLWNVPLLRAWYAKIL